ncbi:hypothetical protein [Pseudomonas sp. P7548]|uniref:hypothetical protein n=1 Tax=Pseudomonas sp. P7548 TaxID=2726981 RepID=UPI0015C06135|nr:hypothetical protein [Pseudomonas sp. P7548]NWE21125.1 hypothetical protein [Pseudomonas sp. P7548]
MDDATLCVPVSYLRVALDIGVIDVVDVVQWADTKLATLENPPYAVIELALMGRSNREEVMWQLLQVATPAISEAEMLPYALAVAHSRLLSEPDLGRRLAEGIYRLWARHGCYLPGALESCGYFDDAYGLADSGIHGSAESIDQELLEFTAGFASLDWQSIKVT